jgi:hypothetical protein
VPRNVLRGLVESVMFAKVFSFLLFLSDQPACRHVLQKHESLLLITAVVVEEERGMRRESRKQEPRDA